MTKENRYRLLFADDDLNNKDNRYIITPFEAEGFIVDVAVTGKEAYELMRENVYDAAIIDNMMPPGGENGSDWSLARTEWGLHTGLILLEKIASDNDIDPKPKCWVLTALPDTKVNEKEKTLFPFVVEHIMKDFSLIELAQKINQELQKEVNPNE